MVMPQTSGIRVVKGWQTCLWTVLFALSSLHSALAYRVVVIDAGHGGSDPGAHWYGAKEKALTLDVAKRVETLLRKNGVTTVMTRRTDKTVSLASRAAIANKYRNSLLVSIHFNASRNTFITGHETFYRSSRGAKIASTIQRAISECVKSKSRGITQKRFAVLRLTSSPAVLVECAFMSNRAEARRCLTASHRQSLALGIARGILRSKRL